MSHLSFLDAFKAFPYDVEQIARSTGIKPPMVDRMINEAMELAHSKLQARKAYRVPYAGFDPQQKAWAGK